MYSETVGGDVYATGDGGSPPRAGYNDGGATCARGLPRAADAFRGTVKRGYVVQRGCVLASLKMYIMVQRRLTLYVYTTATPGRSHLMPGF